MKKGEEKSLNMKSDNENDLSSKKEWTQCDSRPSLDAGSAIIGTFDGIKRMCETALRLNPDWGVEDDQPA